MAGGGEIIAALLAAVRARNEAAIAELLDPDVVVTGNKGTFRGVDAVLRWAKPSDDGQLRSRIEIDEIRELPSDRVAVAGRRQWRWVDGDELADEHPFGALFELRDGRIVTWRVNFESIIDAIDSIPAA